jgi:23S rRNA pseudouridine2605 synthase
MINKTNNNLESQNNLNVSAKRIQKVLAQSGFGSRREIEKAIVDERVLVNNKIAKIGQSIIPTDKIVFKGKLIRLNTSNNLPRVLIYHKPDGELVSENDPGGRKTVFQNLPKIKQGKWISIGRLDFNTSGLLIFTSYGELANKMMHPKYEVDREYSVRVLGELSNDQMKELESGIVLEDGNAKFESINFEGGEGANKWYRVVLKEGKNREVRRMFKHFDMTVSRLIRVRFGIVILPSHLKRGMHTELTQAEVSRLLQKHDIKPESFNKPQLSNQKKRNKRM